MCIHRIHYYNTHTTPAADLSLSGTCDATPLASYRCRCEVWILIEWVSIRILCFSVSALRSKQSNWNTTNAALKIRWHTGYRKVNP